MKLDDLGHPRVRPEAERGQPGYNLGLALHYLTDLTQPMHSSELHAGELAPELHVSRGRRDLRHGASVAGPVPDVRVAGDRPHGAAECPGRAADSCGVAACTNLQLYCQGAAKNSKTKYAKALIDVAGSRYYGWDQDPTYWTRVVDPLIEPMLRDAILYTAQYLVAWIEVAKRSIDYNDAYDARWTLTQGYLTNVSVAADGSVWGVGLQHPAQNDNIYRWIGSGWERQPKNPDQHRSGLRRIGVGRRCTPTDDGEQRLPLVRREVGATARIPDEHRCRRRRCGVGGQHQSPTIDGDEQRLSVERRAVGPHGREVPDRGRCRRR